MSPSQPVACANIKPDPAPGKTTPHNADFADFLVEAAAPAKALDMPTIPGGQEAAAPARTRSPAAVGHQAAHAHSAIEKPPATDSAVLCAPTPTPAASAAPATPVQTHLVATPLHTELNGAAVPNDTDDAADTTNGIGQGGAEPQPAQAVGTASIEPLPTDVGSGGQAARDGAPAPPAAAKDGGDDSIGHKPAAVPRQRAQPSSTRGIAGNGTQIATGFPPVQPDAKMPAADANGPSSDLRASPALTSPAITAPGSAGASGSPPASPTAAGVPTPQPATQIGHAVAAMHVAPDGSSHTIIRLDPAELGLVQVRIVRGHDGAASVSVGVERPETLHSLQADLSHLHQALDRAGLPNDRNVTFHLTGESTPAGNAGNPDGQPGSGRGQPDAERQQRQAHRPDAGHGLQAGFSDGTPPAQLAAARWRTIGTQDLGINITA